MDTERIMATTDRLHHIGLISPSLALSSAQYEKLGFFLTPLSLPRSVIRAGGVPETLGAGNRRAIFKHNYLELTGVVDPQKWRAIGKNKRRPYDLDVPLSRYEGLHEMHFGTRDIEEVKARLAGQGIPSSPVLAFERTVQTDGGERNVRARAIHFPAGANPEALLQIAGHDAPDQVFQKRYMHHRNGAIAMTETIVVAEDPVACAFKYGQYTGHSAKRIADQYFVLELGLSKLTIVNPACLDSIIPGYAVPALPFLAAFTIQTISLHSVRKVLSAGEIAFADRHGTIIVYPENACGCAIIFEEI